ncbi:MFS transporter [Microbacterium aurantiacum]|uniref:MFS transporter n=1 Tax=Microbacterium aurantiacum TaxID=162393 RepID=UPI0015E0F84F|nr:MFS transporter [Microbacterium aurantiacum]
MTVADHDARLSLNTRRAISTFGLSVLGLLTANLLPFMVIALEQSVGLGVTEAGAVMTGCLLATAVACVATTRLAEGSRRVLVARLGLAISAVAFAVAAFNPGDVATILAVIVGGAGAGGALSSSGAALAALRNPNRMSAANGLVNRGVVTIVLAVVPLIGITSGSVFGLVAGASLALLFAATWLPRAPIQTGGSVIAAAAVLVAKPADARANRTVTIAGIALLIMYALWAISEDSVWALAGVMGADQSGLSDAGLGLVLSASSAGGLVAAIALIFIGDKLGRAVPLAILLIAGGALKLIAALTTDPTVYTTVLIAWNTAYMAVFLLFIATAAALDANGRFSGPAIGVYLFGSSFSPVIGGWLAETFGYPGFGWVIALISWILVVPMVIVARISTRVERREIADGQAPVSTEEVSR